MPLRRCLLMLAFLLSCPAALADGPEASYGQELEGFAYPYPVERYAFRSQNEDLEMAYMDVPAAGTPPAGTPPIGTPPVGMPPIGTPQGTAVLLHGKNFCGATWEATIKVLSDAGYRVVVPDQIGFCKSSKPGHYQYSFQQLARNTNALLVSLGIDKAVVIGHSTGGMLGVRYALMYPGQVSRLMLVDPIGLEDWKAEGVPPLSVDQWYERELKTTAEGIRAYEQATYYAGDWRPEYDRWVDMLAGLYRGPGREIVAWNSALIYDMIYTQPVLYELDKLAVPTVLFIGDKDTTAIGKDVASPSVRAKLGDYPALGRRAVDLISEVKLVEFPTLGHAPQIQDPDAFHKALLENMGQAAAPD